MSSFMSSTVSRPKQKQQQRLSTKDASAIEQRKQMTERRHEISMRIRKQKRSHLVQVKRRFHNIQQQQPSQQPSSPEEAANLFLQKRDESSLQMLQQSLGGGFGGNGNSGNNSHQVSLFHNEEEKAMELAKALADALTIPTSTPNARLQSARILTNLAVDQQRQSDGDEDDDDNDSMSYYGRVPRGWCSILASSPAMDALQKGLTSSDMALAEQCAWAVGNLCGDSFEARHVALTSGMMIPLCAALRIGFEMKHVTMCRNAAWALSNLARGVETPALPFLNNNNNNDHNNSQKLDSVFLANLLLYPEQQQQGTSSREWLQVAHEVCWLLAFLTAREEEAVRALLLLEATPSASTMDLSTTTTTIASPLCEAVACRLDYAVRFMVSSSASSFASDDVLRAIQVSLPCLRIVGNIASCSTTTEQALPILLEAQNRSVCKSLATVMEMGTFPSSQSNGDLRAVSVEASWAAGTILCDSGTSNHPSTTIAAPALLPTLCNCLNSQQSPLDLKRQILQAMWNVVAPPPESNVVVDQAWSSRSTRDEYLVQIFRTIPSIMRLLVDLMLNSDMDVVMGSLHVCNAMLRRIGDDNNDSDMMMTTTSTTALPVKRTFLEADGLDALERICDRATESSHYYFIPGLVSDASAAAEMAANLIDDLFSDETEEMMNDNNMIAPDIITTTATTKGDGGSSTTQQMFAFGLPNSGGGTFHFGPTASPITQRPVSSSGSGGLGRGRGQPMVPSWMAQQQQREHNL